MALLGFEGFERQSSQVVENGLLKTLWSTAGNSSATYPAGRFGSGRHLRQTGSSSNNGSITFNVPGIASEGVIGFAVQNELSGFISGSGWIRLREGTTNHLLMYLDSTTRQWIVRNGANTVTLGTSATGGFDPTAWMYVEIKFKIADSGGYIIIRVNEQEILNLTGLDTRNAGAAGVVDNFVVITATGGSYSHLDDLYWLNLVDATATQGAPNNDFLGDVIVDELRPAGNGEQNQWLGSDGNSTDNYLLVDEAVTPSMTDYVGSGTSGQRDNYALTDLGDTYPVFGVNHEVFAAKSDINPFLFDLQATIKHDSTEQVDTICAAAALNTAAGWYRKNNGLWRDLASTPWTTAKVNSLIAGVKLS